LQTRTPEPGADRYRIGELAKLTGLTTRTIRYYEELELIFSERSPGGQRIYTTRSLSRLSIIESLKIAGFKLQEIKRILTNWRESGEGKEGAKKLLDILKTKHEEVTKTVEALYSLKKQLETSIDLLDNCVTCPQVTEPETCDTCGASREGGKKSTLIDEILKS
jgi:DNA-binding transcriptional MerR regulator